MWLKPRTPRYNLRGRRTDAVRIGLSTLGVCLTHALQLTSRRSADLRGALEGIGRSPATLDFMSAICGIVRFDSQGVDPAALEALTRAAVHRGPDGICNWFGEGAGLAHLAFHVTPESVGEAQPLIGGVNGRYILVADARIDNRAELMSALRGEIPLPAAPTDADLIMAAFLRWGEDCLPRLLGDFVFALWDTTARALLLARDALGGRSLSYHYDGRRCIFASEVDQILQAPGFELRINDRKVADYLADWTHEQEETYFESICFCPPAHIIRLSGNGLQKRRYWDIDPDARLRYRDDREYAEHFLAVLADATACRMRSVGNIGLSLSGGLDSTLLAALASRRLPAGNSTQTRLKTFSYVFDRLTHCDERAYITPVVERYDLDARCLPCDDKWALKDLPHWPVERDTIWSDAYTWLVVSVAGAAQDAGCRVLLNGQYGDVLFLGGHYWAAEMLKDGRWLELAKLWRQQHEYVDFNRDLLHYGARQLIPQRIKRLLRRLHLHAPWNNPALHPDLAARTRLRERAQNDPRARRFNRPGQWARLATLCEHSWPQGFCDTRKLYARFGLESESPYFDRRLVELVISLPADQLGRPWRGRWVQRNAMHDLLPNAVVERLFKTDFERLTRDGLFRREAHTVRSLLANPRCVQRGYVRADWLKQTLNRGDPVPQETLYWLWRIIALELWLSNLD